MNSLKESIRKRSGAASVVHFIVLAAVAMIIFATLGIVSLQILATASTTSFQASVVTIVFVVVPILFAIAVAVALFRGGLEGLRA